MSSLERASVTSIVAILLVVCQFTEAGIPREEYNFFKEVTPHSGSDDWEGKAASQARLTRSEYLQWTFWKKEHNREYNEMPEELHRVSVWLSNKRYIEEHNKQAYVHGFDLKMNHFGDLTEEEWTSYFICHKIDSYVERFQQNYAPPSYWNSESPPFSMDWRSRNAVTGIKNQEEYRCHSCYAFAAVGALEGAHAIATGQLIALSPQQVLDCSKRYANYGCQGGNYKFAWNYFIHNGGADRLSCYPYRLKQKSSCKHNGKCIAATMSGFSSITNEEDLRAAVGLSGPVAITFDHRQKSFQFYSGGVYNSTQCSSSVQQATHEMVVVGYGTSNKGVPYWIIKNSYGKNWGGRGYMYLYRGSNMCGVSSNAAIPTI